MEEFKDDQVQQAGLRRKLPSLALKEADCSGSYNPSILNTLMGELYGTAPCKDTQWEKQRAPRFASLGRPERDTHRFKKGVFKTLTRDGRGVFWRD